ncbi:hypothetical protein [Rheinheimera sp. WS51]|uniref:hypothetical protein n=1 Tax=Rheinheimera sp. WS51 TaxID=3425886 RepID=UPI003D8D500B
MQQPNNIQNFNRYSYVLNNPLNKTDPSGYFFQMLVVWAVQYVAAATATTAIGAALSAALTAYSYYGYAQMAIGAVKAIEGGGTAMANFAGGMAKGYAKGAIFNTVMAGASYLASGAGQQPAGEVEGEQGSDTTDGHKKLKVDGDEPKYNGYRKTQHDLKMVNGKLTGTLRWLCNGSSQECSSAISEMNELVSENADFLDIKNELSDGTGKAIRLNFAKEIPSAGRGQTGGYFDEANNELRLSRRVLNDNNFSRIMKHEFGHALGLDHMGNVTNNFMSYSQLGPDGNPSNVKYQLTNYQKESIANAYKEKSFWERLW